MAEDKYGCKAVISLLAEIRDILIEIRDAGIISTNSANLLSDSINKITNDKIN